MFNKPLEFQARTSLNEGMVSADDREACVAQGHCKFSQKKLPMGNNSTKFPHKFHEKLEKPTDIIVSIWGEDGEDDPWAQALSPEAPVHPPGPRMRVYR